MIIAICPSCSVRLQFPDQCAGKPIRCSGCKTVFNAPATTTQPAPQQPMAAPPQQPMAAPPQQPMAAQATPPQNVGIENLVVTCPTCTGQLTVPGNVAGRQIRCPRCQGVFVADATTSAPTGYANQYPPGAVPGVPGNDPMNPNRVGQPKPAAGKGGMLVKIGVGVGSVIALGAVSMCCFFWIFGGGPDPFEELPRPYKAGTMVKVRKIATMPAPKFVKELAYSHKHQLLFAYNRETGVHIIDSKNREELEFKKPKNDEIVAMGLTPSEDYLYISDRGPAPGHQGKQGDHFIHRYDLKQRKWETLDTPKYSKAIYKRTAKNKTTDYKWRSGTKTYYLPADVLLPISDDRFLMQIARPQSMGLMRWADGKIELQSTIKSENPYEGRIYDPRSGRYFFLGRQSKERIRVHSVSGGSLYDNTPSKSASLAFDKEFRKNEGLPVLSTDGDLYIGNLQVDPYSPTTIIREFPEIVRYASDDIVFCPKKCYNANTKEELGKSIGSKLAFSADNTHFWAFSSYKELSLFAIEGEKK